jgi:hypothetical protein
MCNIFGFLLWESWLNDKVKSQHVQHPFTFSVSYDRFNKPWLPKVPSLTSKIKLGFTIKGAQDLEIKNKVFIISDFKRHGVRYRPPTPPSLSFKG